MFVREAKKKKKNPQQRQQGDEAAKEWDVEDNGEGERRSMTDGGTDNGFY